MNGYEQCDVAFLELIFIALSERYGSTVGTSALIPLCVPTPSQGWMSSFSSSAAGKVKWNEKILREQVLSCLHFPIIRFHPLFMTIDPLLKSLASGLGSIRSATSADLAHVLGSLDASKKAVATSSSPIDLWTAGANIASIVPEPATDIRPAEIRDIVKSLESLPISDSKRNAASQPAPPAKKAVSFHPTVKPVDLEQPRPVQTPQTASKVKNMLSAWEYKIQKVTTPHYGKTPMSTLQEESDHVSRMKRKNDEMSEDDSGDAPAASKSGTMLTSAINMSFDGPILEIPDDLLAELEGLEPEVRQARLSVLHIEAQERRKSGAGPMEVDEPQPAAAPVLTGRVAAALKLFTGTTVPKKDFGTVYKSFQSEVKAKKISSESSDAIDGVELEPVKFYDVHEKGVVEVEFEGDVEDEEEVVEMEVSQLHQQEAAQAVAEDEAVKAELEKSAWLADIEEIRIVSTPAKAQGIEKSGDWSAVTQKMSLSCALTPVVPGRRSCIAIKPVMAPLGPKDEEDQYEISDKDTDSENELSPNSRAKKHIPAWCVNWRQKAIAQIAVDPESIFGLTVPKCELEIVITERNYRKMGLQRPSRLRGSSGNWTFDKLTQDEVDRYRAKLGQVVKADGVFVNK